MYLHKGWYFPDIEKDYQLVTGEYPETCYQQGALDTALSYVKKFDIALDIGANIGLHSVRLSKIFKSVFAFEPTKYNFECLEKNVLNLSNVKIFNVGLSNKEIQETIRLPIDCSTSGAFSIVDFNDQLETITETIICKTLDSFNINADFIKIDTQGFEPFILEGALNTLQNKPVLLVETETKERYDAVEYILRPLGYKDVATIRKKDHVWIYNDQQ
jgi:FkbM family methyltransferase